MQRELDRLTRTEIHRQTDGQTEQSKKFQIGKWTERQEDKQTQTDGHEAMHKDL